MVVVCGRGTQFGSNLKWTPVEEQKEEREGKGRRREGMSTEAFSGEGYLVQLDLGTEPDTKVP